MGARASKDTISQITEKVTRGRRVGLETVGSDVWTSKLINGSWTAAAATGLDMGAGAGIAGGADSAGNIYLFWRGGDGALWEGNGDGGSWVSQHSIPTAPAGALSSAPGLAVGTDGKQYVFWKGNDNHLWQTIWDGSNWRGPYGLGANVGPGAALTAAMDPSGAAHVFWRGGDNGLWESHWTGSTWSSAGNVLGGGVLASEPAVAIAADGKQYVLWKGTDNKPRQSIWDGAT